MIGRLKLRVGRELGKLVSLKKKAARKEQP